MENKNSKSFSYLRHCVQFSVAIVALVFNVKATEIDKFSIAIDGGGIRGVYPAAVLMRLETDLQKRVNSKVYLSECVDVFGGTSTGGLIAIALNIPNRDGTSPKYHAQDVLRIYQDYGAQIFISGWTKGLYGSKYYRENLESVVRNKILGGEILEKLGNTTSPKFEKPFSGKVIVPAYKLERSAEVVFATDNPDYGVDDIAFATSAAPFYFNAYTCKDGNETYFDGGLIENNPAFDSLLETYKQDPVEAKKKVFLLSIGSGHTPKSYKKLANRGALSIAR